MVDTSDKVIPNIIILLFSEIETVSNKTNIVSLFLESRPIQDQLPGAGSSFFVTRFIFYWLELGTFYYVATDDV